MPGTERGMDLPAVARAASDPANLPEGMALGLDSSVYKGSSAAADGGAVPVVKDKS